MKVRLIFKAVLRAIKKSLHEDVDLLRLNCDEEKKTFQFQKLPNIN